MDLPPVIPFDSIDNNILSEKISLLLDNFRGKFGASPQFVARVPGRVNLIGEHIDYCGYAVFPMAIDQEILVAFSPRDDQQLKVSNWNKNYSDLTCELNGFSIDKTTLHWYKYYLCGIKGVMEKPEHSAFVWKGVNASIYGSIPPSAGLSSSSALVCAAALSFSYANNALFTKQQLADRCAKSECYIGTEGGGMDQAIAMLATRGTAKLIEFNPLRAHDTKLPSGAVFVIAHCLVEANKAATLLFNCRVMECRLGAKVLAKLLGVNPELVMRLVDVQQFLNKTLAEMADVVRLYLHDEPYPKEELAKLLEITENELETQVLSENTRKVDSFKLKQRALHVFQEANRVWQFQDICKSEPPEALEALGRLMFDSHQSCRDLYECSHPQLDRLVQMSTKLALGARLTGAGWGGCIVALVPENSVTAFINNLKENFYRDLPAAQGRDVDQVIFATQPGAGASIYTF